MNQFPPPPSLVRHAEPSYLFSADDERFQPSPKLIELSSLLVKEALSINLDDICSRMKAPPFYPSVWPGEHYKLLAAIVKLTKPKTIIEVGTAQGLSALAFRKYLSPDGKVHTFDVIPWHFFNDTVLKAQDFEEGLIVQHIADLSKPQIFQSYQDIIKDADIIFLDGPKDVATELSLLSLLKGHRFSKPPLCIVDDIRLWQMLKIWRDIDRPKLDITSFGHWSGTGLFFL